MGIAVRVPGYYTPEHEHDLFRGRGRGQFQGQGRGQGQFRGRGQFQGQGRGQGQFHGRGQFQEQGRGQGQFRGRGQFQEQGRGRGQFQGQERPDMNQDEIARGYEEHQKRTQELYNSEHPIGIPFPTATLNIEGISEPTYAVMLAIPGGRHMFIAKSYNRRSLSETMKTCLQSIQNSDGIPSVDRIDISGKEMTCIALFMVAIYDHHLLQDQTNSVSLILQCIIKKNNQLVIDCLGDKPPFARTEYGIICKFRSIALKSRTDAKMRTIDCLRALGLEIKIIERSLVKEPTTRQDYLDLLCQLQSDDELDSWLAKYLTLERRDMIFGLGISLFSKKIMLAVISVVRASIQQVIQQKKEITSLYSLGIEYVFVGLRRQSTSLFPINTEVCRDIMKMILGNMNYCIMGGYQELNLSIARYPFYNQLVQLADSNVYAQAMLLIIYEQCIDKASICIAEHYKSIITETPPADLYWGSGGPDELFRTCMRNNSTVCMTKIVSMYEKLDATTRRAVRDTENKLKKFQEIQNLESTEKMLALENIVPDEQVLESTEYCDLSVDEKVRKLMPYFDSEMQMVQVELKKNRAIQSRILIENIVDFLIKKLRTDSKHYLHVLFTWYIANSLRKNVAEFQEIPDSEFDELLRNDHHRGGLFKEWMEYLRADTQLSANITYLEGILNATDSSQFDLDGLEFLCQTLARSAGDSVKIVPAEKTSTEQ